MRKVILQHITQSSGVDLILRGSDIKKQNHTTNIKNTSEQQCYKRKQSNAFHMFPLMSADAGWDVLSTVYFLFLCFCFHQFATVLLSIYVAAAVQVSYLRCSYPAARVTKNMLMVSIVQDRVNICLHTHAQLHTQRDLPSKKTSSLLSVLTRKWKEGQLSLTRFRLDFFYTKAKRSTL